MVYMGSKNRYAKFIVPILQEYIDKNNVDTYIECFCGGCNIIDKISCKNRIAYDRSDTLIALLDLASKDFTQVLPAGSRELWDKGKAYVKDGIMPEDMSLADIGAMEFLASFSNGGFPRGYAKNTSTRDYYNEAYSNLEKQAPDLDGIIFKCQNYWELDKTITNAVIYLDPPYEGTKQYGYANMEQMDYTKYWNWVREISMNNYVFCSEQNAPEDFIPIWTQAVTRTTNTTNDFKAVENLFIYDKGKANQ